MVGWDLLIRSGFKHLFAGTFDMRGIAVPVNQLEDAIFNHVLEFVPETGKDLGSFMSLPPNHARSLHPWR